MPGKKFNYKKFLIFCTVVLFVIVAIIFGILSLVNNIKYRNTYEYKFLDMGYTLEEEKVFEEKLNNNELNTILKSKYNSDIDNFVNEKYFLFKNLNNYLTYKKDNSNKKYSEVVSIINTEANIEWIDEEKDTDTSKNELMLVNRLYGLKKDYVPTNIIDAPLKYSYKGIKIDESILEDIVSLISSGKEVGYTFVISYGYRSYADQEKMYNSYVNSYGQSEADNIVARPGHSEYQTGFAFDLQPYNKVFDNAFESEEYTWLKENSYKYGFIMRLEQDKEEITGFTASPWKLRYVGVDAATKIHNEAITFEEYYAYYVIGDKK